MREDIRTCTVPAPLDRVRDFLADYRNVIRLCSSHADAELESGRPGIAGASYRVRLQWEGLPAEFVAVLKTADRGWIEWVANGTGSTGAVSFVLAPRQRATAVTLRAALSLDGAVRPLEPFAWALLTRLEDRFVRRLSSLDLARPGEPPAVPSR